MQNRPMIARDQQWGWGVWWKGGGCDYKGQPQEPCAGGCALCLECVIVNILIAVQ